MKKFLLALAAFLCVAAPAYPQAGFFIPAKLFNPGYAYTGDCTLKAPSPRCCADFTGASCDPTPVYCETNADCSGGYTKCVVLQGDHGQRCCTSSAATDCQRYQSGVASGDAYCDSNSDCTGNSLCTGNTIPFSCCTGNGTGTCSGYATCANKYPIGSELPFPKWECTDSNSPKLYAEFAVPDDLTSYTLTCSVHFNTKAITNTTSAVFKLRAMAMNSWNHPGTPTLTGGNFPTITVSNARNPFWRTISGTGSFCIEDANNSGNCCTGSSCKNKILKLELTLDSTTTVATPVRIRGVYCSYS